MKILKKDFKHIYAVIYKFTNMKNEAETYIGKTVNFDSRIACHITNMKNYKKYSYDNIYLYRSVDKYGWENFQIEIVDVIRKQFSEIHEDYYTFHDLLVCEIEKYYIKKFESFGKGYNLTAGGEGMSGHKPSDKTRKQMSESAKLKIFTDEHRANLSKAFKDRIFTDSHRKHLSEAILGKTHSPERKSKYSGKNHSQFKGKIIIIGHIKENMPYKIGHEFECASFAAKELGISKKYISKVLNHKQKSVSGYIFAYVDVI